MGDAYAGMSAEAAGVVSLENRPGVLIVGSPNVGKRTILSRLLSIDIDESLDSSDSILCHGWTINTKYYSADISMWTAQLDGTFSLSELHTAYQLAALVLVFDLTDSNSLVALQDWVSHNDIKRFEILVCIGNKTDLLPGHFAHIEYRKRLQKHGKSFSDTHSEYGILASESTSLLVDEDLPSNDLRNPCMEWCINNSIEYFEACGSNAEFDKCLSVDGDIQGMDRLVGALSAHMWPGMVLKSGDRIDNPVLIEENVSTEESEEESDVEFEYEVLSGGIYNDPSDVDKYESWADFTDDVLIGTRSKQGSRNVHGIKIGKSKVGEPSIRSENSPTIDPIQGHVEQKWTTFTDYERIGSTSEKVSTNVDGIRIGKSEACEPSTTCEKSSVNDSIDEEQNKWVTFTDDKWTGTGSEEVSSNAVDITIHRTKSPITDPTEDHGESCEISDLVLNITEQRDVGIPLQSDKITKTEDNMHYDYDDIDRVMSEIGNMRGSLRLMPDFQRREMAASLAMKMASMFGCSSDDEDFS